MSVAAVNPDLLTRAEAAGYLRTTVGTLAVWACRGTPPIPHIKLGRKVLYRRADLDRVLAAGLVTPQATR